LFSDHSGVLVLFGRLAFELLLDFLTSRQKLIKFLLFIIELILDIVKVDLNLSLLSQQLFGFLSFITVQFGLKALRSHIISSLDLSAETFPLLFRILFLLLQLLASVSQQTIGLRKHGLSHFQKLNLDSGSFDLLAEFVCAFNALLQVSHAQVEVVEVFEVFLKLFLLAVLLGDQFLVELLLLVVAAFPLSFILGVTRQKHRIVVVFLSRLLELHI